MTRRGLLSSPGASMAEVAAVEENGETVIERYQDCQSVVDRARLHRDIGADRLWGEEKVRFVASIPQILIDQAIREGWIHDADRWTRLLNDCDYRDLRIGGGRL